MSTQRRQHDAPARGFTLVEITVVIIILALLATMTIPRLLGHEKRVLDHTADKIADMLTMFAQRSAIDQRPVALDYLAEQGILEIIALEPPLEPGQRPRWIKEPLVRAVVLPPHITLEAWADGVYIADVMWPIVAAPGQKRPRIDITIRGYDLQTEVRLASAAIAPEIPSRQQRSTSSRRVRDLDEMGRSRDDW